MLKKKKRLSSALVHCYFCCHAWVAQRETWRGTIVLAVVQTWNAFWHWVPEKNQPTSAAFECGHV